MPAYSRTLLLFSALAVAALLTWVLARDANVMQSDEADDLAAPPQGYYLIGAVLHVTNAEGKVYFRVLADRVDHASNEQDFGLEGVRVEYTPEAEIGWELTAARGVMSRDRSALDLSDVRLTNTSARDGNVVVFETGELRLDASTQIANTAPNQKILFRDERSELSATGLHIDLRANTFELEANVMSLRSTLAVSAVALSTLTAQGQPDAPVRDESVRCSQGITGDLPNNHYECRGFRIQYDETTEVSADLATASTTNFDQGEFDLVHPHIQMNSLSLEAETATIWSGADEIEGFELTGNPVVMSDYIEESGTPITAQAMIIAYDRGSDTLRMSGDVRFTVGTEGSAIESCALTYELRAKRFEIGTEDECGTRVSLSGTDIQNAGEEQDPEPSEEP